MLPMPADETVKPGCWSATEREIPQVTYLDAGADGRARRRNP